MVLREPDRLVRLRHDLQTVSCTVPDRNTGRIFCRVSDYGTVIRHPGGYRLCVRQRCRFQGHDKRNVLYFWRRK